MFYRNFFIYYISIAIGGLLLLTVFVYQSNLFKIKTFLNSEIYSLKANHAFEDKNYGEAEIFYKKALLHNPNSDESVFNLGNSFYSQGRYADAAETYRRLIAILNAKGKDTDLTWNNLGNAYYKMGLIIQSQKAYQKAMIENIDDEVIRQNFLYVSQIIKMESKKQRKFTKNKKNDKNAEKIDKNSSDNDTDKLNDNDRPNGPYQLSNKEMQQLLNLSNEKIRVPQATRSARSKKTNSNGPDY